MLKKLLLLFLISGSFKLVGQNIPVDEKEAHLARWFTGKTGEQHAPMMKGHVYSMEPRSQTTHQFFESKFFSPGSFKTISQLYVDQLLAFDLETETLILKHPDSSRFDGIALDMEVIPTFEVLGHYFKRFPTGGYYDILYESDSISLTAKRKKERKAEQEGVVFDETINYFLYYENELYKLRSIRSLKPIFPQHYAALKKIAREEKLKIRPRREANIVSFVKRLNDLIF